MDQRQFLECCYSNDNMADYSIYNIQSFGTNLSGFKRSSIKLTC